MTIDDLIRAFKRRGYAVVDRTLAEFPRMIILWVACDTGMPVESSPGVQRVIWAKDLPTIQENLGEHLARMLESMSGGQHHMWCAHCKEPLLHTVNQQKALDTYQRRSMPDMVLETKPERVNDVLLQWTERRTIPVDVIVKTSDAGLDAIKQAMEYRSSKAGPSSPVLTNCPGCGCVLSSETVGEIVDVEQ